MVVSGNILMLVAVSVFFFVVQVETLPTGIEEANDDVEFMHLPRILRKRSTPRVISKRATTGEGEKDLMLQILEENAEIVSSTARGSKILLEGDIYLGVRGGQRNAIKDPKKLWQGGRVPYIFHQDFDAFPEAKHKILTVMDHYRDLTCINFIPRTDEKDYIELVALHGCWSSVGRDGGRQQLSLGQGCTEALGVIMHEFMHALGFYHEQSRTDRDQYVRIIEENIFPYMDMNFEKYGHDHIDDLGFPYDYGSIMHYPRKAFSSNDLDTIVPKQKDAEIGQRQFFSEIDLFKINKLYRCDSATENPAEVEGCKMEIGYIRRGNNMNNGAKNKKASATDCCVDCRNTAGCQSWSYNKKTGGCWLKNAVPGQTLHKETISGVIQTATSKPPIVVTKAKVTSKPPIVTTEAEATTKPPIVTTEAGGCDMEIGYNRPGNDLNLGYNNIKKSAGECCSDCGNNADCKSWSYNVKDGACWLKDSVPKQRVEKNTISGVAPCSGDDKFMCSDGGCIPSDYKCDIVIDCQDGSDEEFCEETEICDFRCPNDECLSSDFVCDGFADCSDQSDETDCGECEGTLCPNGVCIEDSWVCDGFDDCNDGSDEANCATTKPPIITTMAEETTTVIQTTTMVPPPTIQECEDAIYRHSPKRYQYQYIESPYFLTRVDFRVKAGRDAHIGLSSEPMDQNAMYEIVLGAGGNKWSAIRRGRLSNQKFAVDSPGIVSLTEYRGFWIAYNDGVISVGKEGELPFMEWTDPNPLPVNNVGYTTYHGNTGDFVFCISSTGCDKEIGFDRPGSDLNNGNNNIKQSAEECCLDCQDTAGSSSWAFNTVTGACWCKDGVPQLTVLPGTISGVIPKDYRKPHAPVDNTPSKQWRDDLRCGSDYPLSDGSLSECNPNGEYPCCSPAGWCGNTQWHCSCSGCANYRPSAPAAVRVVCKDNNQYCNYWSGIGECWRSAAYMNINCKKSCGIC